MAHALRDVQAKAAKALADKDVSDLTRKFAEQRAFAEANPTFALDKEVKARLDNLSNSAVIIGKDTRILPTQKREALLAIVQAESDVVHGAEAAKRQHAASAAEARLFHRLADLSLPEVRPIGNGRGGAVVIDMPDTQLARRQAQLMRRQHLTAKSTSTSSGNEWDRDASVFDRLNFLGHELTTYITEVIAPSDRKLAADLARLVAREADMLRRDRPPATLLSLQARTGALLLRALASGTCSGTGIGTCTGTGAGRGNY